MASIIKVEVKLNYLDSRFREYDAAPSFLIINVTDYSEIYTVIAYEPNPYFSYRQRTQRFFETSRSHGGAAG